MESPFPDLDRTIDANRCVRCRILFKVGDAVQQVWFVAGVGPHPRTGRRVPFLMDAPSFGHGRCADRTLAQVPNHPEISRQSLKAQINEDLRPRTPEYLCHLCKTPVVRGAGIVAVTRVLGVGIDPETKFPGIEVSYEFESVHFDCRDPFLSLGGALQITL